MDGRTIVIEVTEEEAERGLFYMPWVDLRESTSTLGLRASNLLLC